MVPNGVWWWIYFVLYKKSFSFYWEAHSISGTVPSIFNLEIHAHFEAPGFNIGPWPGF